MAEDYDLRSNIKGKPNAQGTLFRAPKGLLNPSQRWPRGYTPQRQRAVDAAMPEDVGDYSWPVPKREHQFRDKARQAISRSTVPTGDLAGLTGIWSDPQAGDAATYWHKDARIDWGTQYATRNYNLIHEIGHHVSARRRIGRSATQSHAMEVTGEKKGPVVTAVKHRIGAGVEEAVADDYAEKHFRPDKRERKTDVANPYDSRFSRAQLNEYETGYTWHRPSRAAPLGVQFDAHKQGELF